MSSEFRSDSNTNVLGKFKSEVGSKIISEFVALSPKSYCYKYCIEEIKKAKGVSLSISKKTMTFSDYKRVLDSNQHRPGLSMASGLSTNSFTQHVKTRWC
jgi:hypothetical protein